MPDLSSQEAPEDLDWELHAWTEVNLDTFKELCDQLKERAIGFEGGRGWKGSGENPSCDPVSHVLAFSSPCIFCAQEVEALKKKDNDERKQQENSQLHKHSHGSAKTRLEGNLMVAAH